MWSGATAPGPQLCVCLSPIWYPATRREALEPEACLEADAQPWRTWDTESGEAASLLRQVNILTSCKQKSRDRSKEFLLISCPHFYKYTCKCSFFFFFKLQPPSHMSPVSSTYTHIMLAPVAKQLSEMWQCGAPMLHHCHRPITCIPSPPSPSPLHPSIHQDFLDTGLWQGHIHSLVVHHLYKGAGMGRGCGAVPNSFTSWDGARCLFVLFPFSFVSAEWVHYLSDSPEWSVMDFNHFSPLITVYKIQKMIGLLVWSESTYLVLSRHIVLLVICEVGH